MQLFNKPLHMAVSGPLLKWLKRTKSLLELLVFTSNIRLPAISPLVWLGSFPFPIYAESQESCL